MAAYTIANLRADGVNVGTSTAPVASHTAPSPYCLSIDLDFAAITAARVAAGETAFATNDVVEVIPIPAKTYILAVGVDVTTADGTASTIDIGLTGGDVDGWIDGADANAIGSEVGIGAESGGLLANSYQASATTLSMTMLTAPQDASVMRVWALMCDCSGN
jgi:hypothetical protein